MKYLAILFLLTTSCAGIHVLKTNHVTGKDGRCYEESIVSDNGVFHSVYHEEPCGIINIPKI